MSLNPTEWGTVPKWATGAVAAAVAVLALWHTGRVPTRNGSSARTTPPAPNRHRSKRWACHTGTVGGVQTVSHAALQNPCRARRNPSSMPKWVDIGVSGDYRSRRLTPFFPRPARVSSLLASIVKTRRLARSPGEFPRAQNRLTRRRQIGSIAASLEAPVGPKAFHNAGSRSSRTK